MKKVVDLEAKGGGKSGLLYVLAALIVAAFVVLLLVGFENILGILRYRFALFLALGPLIGVFLWCAYKAVGSRDRR